MKYCRTCILPNTRPNLDLSKSEICSACRNFGSKKVIDWKARESDFDLVVQNAKKLSKGYDCLIPVSGGKDSTWQTVKCLEKGLNPLCVTWKTPARTSIGQKNLDNLINLGIDHIDYQISPSVEKKFLLKALKRFGATAIPMHMAMFNIPLKIASKFEIPLVVWGENSAFEYGGAADEKIGFRLDSNWYNKYGVTNGTTAKDWIGENLSEKELTPYFGPDPDELERSGTLAIFLGYYFKWDAQMTHLFAERHGFCSSPDGKTKTGIYDFADIDDDFISLHHWLKWYKFGFTRSFDNLSLEIRNGRITRDEAIDKIASEGDETPYSDIEKFCDFTGITKKEFMQIIEKFRNTKIWKQKKNGIWYIPDFLISDWEWEQNES